MQCFICGEPMRVVMVEPHHLIAMPGFQLRTFQCVGCGDVEKRPFFDCELARRMPALVAEASETPETSEASETSETSEASQTPAAPPPGSRVKSLLGGLVRFRGGKLGDR